MIVRRIHDRERIHRSLESQPVENAWLLGYLDGEWSDHCDWYGYSRDDGLETLVLVYTGLSRPGLFIAGWEGGIRPILREMGNQLPDRATAHIDSAHLQAVEVGYAAPRPLRHMMRMGLRREDAMVDVPEGITVERLTHADTAAIMALYAHWPDHFFEPFQLESGFYFGVRDGQRLASIAGIHAVNERCGVAAIGNLVTHPNARGRGFAKACTATLLRDVFDRVELVTLDVEHGNEPAIRTYQHFGFRRYGDFYEGEIVRR
jgi:ribosomal protein S18 acetylase RimI-like enzyme